MKLLHKVILSIASLLIIVGSVLTWFAFDKKDNYYNSENYTALNKNAYVGGDAYNYIINSNYFTGYLVLASCAYLSGCVLMASIIVTHKSGTKHQAIYVPDATAPPEENAEQSARVSQIGY